MRGRTKTILSVLAMILILLAASYSIYRITDHFKIVEVDIYTIFEYDIQGIFGENATNINGSWYFTPLAYTINSFEATLQETNSGFTVNITLRETRCICSKSFWFWANLTVLNFNCTIYSNDSAVFFIENQSNVLDFDFGIFSTDMQIILFIDTLPKYCLINTKTGEIKLWL